MTGAFNIWGKEKQEDSSTSPTCPAMLDAVAWFLHIPPNPRTKSTRSWFSSRSTSRCPSQEDNNLAGRHVQPPDPETPQPPPSPIFALWTEKERNSLFFPQTPPSTPASTADSLLCEDRTPLTSPWPASSSHPAARDPRIIASTFEDDSFTRV